MYIECSDKAEVDRLFSALSKGGEPSMKPEETFWGAYFGSLVDAFGISWMMSFQQ
ncbi:MAG: VOC family protein [Bdellovibrionota bacterium]